MNMRVPAERRIWRNRDARSDDDIVSDVGVIHDVIVVADRGVAIAGAALDRREISDRVPRTDSNHPLARERSVLAVGADDAMVSRSSLPHPPGAASHLIYGTWSQPGHCREWAEPCLCREAWRSSARHFRSLSAAKQW